MERDSDSWAGWRRGEGGLALAGGDATPWSHLASVTGPWRGKATPQEPHRTPHTPTQKTSWGRGQCCLWPKASEATQADFLEEEQQGIQVLLVDPPAWSQAGRAPLSLSSGSATLLLSQQTHLMPAQLCEELVCHLLGYDPQALSFALFILKILFIYE